MLRVACAVLSLLATAQTSSPGPLKTIITVKSSPYCTALAQHFNGAFGPMLANNRTLDGVGVQLDDLNKLFNGPDYAQRFLAVREHLMRYDNALLQSLPAIHDEIGRLHDAASLTTDDAAAHALTDSAGELTRAYIKQRAMAIDLQGIVQGMMDYDVTRPHPLGGWTPNDNTLPADAKDIKSYLRFDGQRDVIERAENRAVDIAYDAALKHCSK